MTSSDGNLLQKLLKTKLKKKSTNKLSKENMNLILQKSFVAATLLLVFILTLPQDTEGSTASQLDKKINTVSKKLNQKQTRARSLQSQINVFNAQINRLKNQMWKTQNHITETNAGIKRLDEKIKETESDLKVQKKILDEYLKTLYENGETSTVEIIATSGTFSDFVDKAEYLQVMQMKIREIVDKIKALKDELGMKKEELRIKAKSLNELKKKQTLQKRGLDNQRAYRDRLLRQVRAQAHSYQRKLNSLYAQKAALSAQFGEGFVGGGSGYPYGSPPAGNLIDTPDPWGYLIGECTSYVAWKRASIGRPVARAMGNAGAWAGSSNSSTPSVGAVAIFPYVGYYGHVAIVDAVYGNGSILISEYNWTPCSFSRRVINPYNYGIVYIR